MKQRISYSIFGALAIAVTMLFAPSIATVNAQTASPCPVGQDCVNKGLSDIAGSFPNSGRVQDFPTLVKTVINWALYLSAIVAVIFIIIGGFLYITSAGNDSQAKKGRDTLVNALIGLTIIVLSYMIVQVVYNFLAR